MLFVLTGDVQIGKTRWLTRRVEELAAAGVPVAGVVAPGVWRERQPGEPDGVHGGSAVGRFEKLGIDNVLLPGGERVPFARRRDLAQAAGTYEAASQSAQAQLGWAIDDAAIDRVNAHFAQIAAGVGDARPGLLVVDELGRLELLRGAGLTAAVELLDGGPTARFPHALIVVRDRLLDDARARFAPAWGAPVLLAPDDSSTVLLRSAFEGCALY